MIECQGAWKWECGSRSSVPLPSPQVLNSLKSSLHSLVAMGHHLRKTIAIRKDELSKFDADLVSVEDEKAVADRTTRRLKDEMDDM